MKAWVTQASPDEGVDAVAINEDPLVGGIYAIQAKRYKNVVGVEAVQALAGAMNDKAATKGILVTTSWFGKASRDFVARKRAHGTHRRAQPQGNAARASRTRRTDRPS